MKKLIILFSIPLLSIAQNEKIQISLGSYGAEGMGFGLGYELFNSTYVGINLTEYSSNNFSNETTLTNDFFNNATTNNDSDEKSLKYGLFIKKYLKSSAFIFSSISLGSRNYNESLQTSSVSENYLPDLVVVENEVTSMAYQTNSLINTNSTINEDIIESSIGVGYSYVISERFRFETSVFSIFKTISIEEERNETEIISGTVEWHNLYNSDLNAFDANGNVIYGTSYVPEYQINETPDPVLTSLKDSNNYFNLGISFSFILTF